MTNDSQILLDANSYRLSTGSSTTATGTKELGENAFMTLLVKQMESQDPLQPMDNQAFVAQLATFSSLQQLTDLNTRMDAVISGQTQLVNSQSLSLIGRQVVADTGGSMTLGDSGADTIVAAFDGKPASARVEILDPKGGVVRRIAITDTSSGEAKVQWDGKNEQGQPVAKGTYNFRVVQSDGAGNETAGKAYLSLLVDGIHVGASGIQLVSGDRLVNFGNVIEIRTPPASTTGTSSGTGSSSGN
jgi:flagellar basal-body rod modification protein FlgD